MSGLVFGRNGVDLADKVPPPVHEDALQRMGRLRITTEVVDTVAVVSVIGDLDARTAPTAQRGLVSAMPEKTPVLLDLTEVRYISSAGLRTMLMVYRQAQRTGTPIALVGVSDALRAVLSATGFLRFFDVADSLTAGIAAIRSE